MFVTVWIMYFGLICPGTGLGHLTRHERTRYVSSKNQIYGGDFDVNEKYIPFVHFWEKPLQILEDSMKIPKKLSSRPLFSWDIPVPNISIQKMSTPENSIKSVTETVAALKNPKHSDTVTNVQKNTHKSRSDRAKASVVLPDSFALIPMKIKKSGNRKKSIEGLENLRAFSESSKTSVTLDPNGRLKKNKKTRKSRKRKLDKSGKRRKTIGRVKEMNDQVKEVPELLEKNNEILMKSPCEMLEDKCEYQCKEINGKAVCVCYRGFTLEGNKCKDINECETNNGGCNGKCVNTIGSLKCICSAGFRLVDGVCADINECLLRNGHGPCQDQCVNTASVASRKGDRNCLSVNLRCHKTPEVRGVEDLTNTEAISAVRRTYTPFNRQCPKHKCANNGRNLFNCQMNQNNLCIVEIGSYYCTCDNLPGTILSSDKHTCEDTHKCNVTSAGCSHTCINLSGRAFCTCPDGLELGEDWKTCHDIDECSNPEDYDVRCESECVNTLGSYTCVTPSA